MILHKSFKHGWFYHYRVHIPKTESLCYNLQSLKEYLLQVRNNCPDEYFQYGPRSSRLKMNLDLDLKLIKGHEVSELAYLGLKNARFKTAHSNVQMFMLQNDDKTISIEVPIWLLSDELSNYENILMTKEPLTGHIDVLRIEDNKIWIWDYKPNARREKYASIQTNFYALMLSKRTGLPLDIFRCGYFDEKDAFIFRPKMVSSLLKE
ncbi:MAG: hypothetical protein KatS3mg002_0631 [Candidatus Woesearchaeota archaeon]|nr:MAG: hypothetical protein KatS3mg002_0631 [Candidatus Woesearchaeota archaeon]